MKAMRASQESSRTRPEDVARNFEELIHSDQTIQYTLTPESMRDMDSTRSITDGSPLMPTKSRKSEDARQANGSRSRSSSVARPADRKRSVSVSRTTGLNSHPVEASQSGGKLTGPVPRAPPVSMQNRLRANGPQARDARIPRESLADFAEFIRATGPVEDAKPAAVRRNPDVVRSASGPLPSSASKARGAVVDYRDDNSDLIDFIRRGPPNSGGNPRIPRTVAPFRTTMDSDQMTGAIGGKAVDATIPDLRYSQASTNVTDLSMPSVQSSVNSQTALLGRNKPLPTQSHNQFDDEDMMPKRKTRRVRDPYAIDFSDEEEDDDFEEMPRRRAQPKEESLMDFLRNAPPPPQSSPVPLNIPQTRTLPKKKASATSLIARFARHGSSGSNSLRSPTTRPATSTPDSKAPNSRGHGGSRGFVPIQVSVASGNDRSVPSRSSSIVGGSNAQSMHPAGRATIKKFQPREAVPKVSREVTDLADFLRNSEPPPSMNNGNSFAAVDREESSGFSRVFARRKKSTLA
ncbi:FLO11-like protein [Pleurostoma richardsiae]|uniref:FLO11-like protein n=1 Tax=Pleurostoma richardsiae TaxID=41990 RepID=A0AA38VKC7_9PEZI|nr:FLO11-like protein [Pleurostoma richardsiae]